jgi:histidinol dehydrogenase
VRVERLVAGRGDAAAAAARLRALAPGGASVAGAVAEIVGAVRERGDTALREYVETLDAVQGPLLVAPDDLATALAGLDARVRAGLEVAIDNVRAVAEAGVSADRELTLAQGHRIVLREVPVRRAAIYVPGGRAPYPSTVVMGVITARAAGVQEIAVCAPGAHPVILAACALCGADEVFRMGGAQAVAALALGTDTVRRVDVIAGPGSLYVQEAKRQLSGEVGIDSFAGPSDVLVLADGSADPELIAADLLAQAEHGEGTIVVLASDDEGLIEATAEWLGTEGEALAALVRVTDMEAGLTFADAFAPEHLELIGPSAEALASRVRSAGCLFVGASGATAFGDYVAGSNHCLPTAGAARFASGLSAQHFRRRMSEVHIDAAAGALASAGAPVARAEGFDRHAVSMELRENPEP